MTNICEQEIVSYSFVLLKHIKYIIISILISTTHHLIFPSSFSLYVLEKIYTLLSVQHSHATMYKHTHTCTHIYILIAAKLLLNLFIMIVLDCVSIKYYLGPDRQKFSQIFSCAYGVLHTSGLFLALWSPHLNHAQDTLMCMWFCVHQMI